MAHDHEHGNPRELTAQMTRPLVIVIAITGIFTVVEFIGGLLSGSLALMSDAGHMLTDTLALILSLAAVRVALRPSTDERTFGYIRAEILAALVNGAVLIFITVLIFYEAILRFISPPEINGGTMLIVAVAGLAANAAGAYVLHHGSKASLNIRGAFLHMLSDLLSSIGVIGAALLILAFGFTVADPVLSVAIGAIILYGAWKLVTQSTSILLESVPSHLKLSDVKVSLEETPGVVEVHDLHIWTVSSGLHALSAHIVVEDRLVSDCSGVVTACEEMLRDKYSISHTTFQFECEACAEGVCVFQPRVKSRKESASERDPHPRNGS